MKKHIYFLLCSSLFLLLFSISVIDAQTFSSVQKNPFSLTDIPDTRSTTALVDLDDDGDIDLMSGSADGYFYYFENTGTKSSPSFAPVQKNPFSLTDIPDTRSTTALVDLDDDGDMDLMSGSVDGSFFYFENSSFSDIFNGKINENTVIIFPNPSTDGIFFFQNNTLFNHGNRIEIFNTLGKLVYQNKIDWQMPQFDLSSQSDGIYFIRFYYGADFYSEKIMKLKH
jgi:hypothetical protein